MTPAYWQGSHIREGRETKEAVYSKLSMSCVVGAGGADGGRGSGFWK